MRGLVTLMTDFGTADGYVAELKGVIVSRAPSATILDLTHEIPPQDVEAARLALARYWRRFPAGTVHVAIVDPEVGTGRAALAVESDGRFLVGPDNGILSPALLFLGAQPGELLGLAQQRQHAVANQVRRGLVTGDQQSGAELRGFLHAEFPGLDPFG
jgi:S-adenosylmethionine hydrolase